MSKKRWPLLATLFALLLLAAACGESTETETASTASGDQSTDGAVSDGDRSDDETSDGESSMEHGDHQHGEALEVPDGMAVPTIAIEAVADTVSGHNLLIDLGEFTITPENASTEPVDGEGHLHLYIDGKRRLRFYNEALHIDGLSAGDHEVMVEVSANDHSAYAIDGTPIRAMTTISVPEADGESEGHAHSRAELFETAEAPTVELTASKDPKSGWNLMADVSGFEFAPESVGSDAVGGEGHLHLYIDGKKITRLYGPWWHVAELEAGNHEIMVEVSANDHTAYGLDGEPLSAVVMVEVDEADAMASPTVDDSATSADGNEDTENEADDGGHSHSGSGELMDMAAADADVVIEASLAGGDFDIEDRRFRVETDSTVGIMMTSDTEEQVHVHGYDLLVSIGPDNPLDISFLADSPGTFEVELEDSGRFLFEIQVS